MPNVRNLVLKFALTANFLGCAAAPLKTGEIPPHVALTQQDQANLRRMNRCFDKAGVPMDLDMYRFADGSAAVTGLRRIETSNQAIQDDLLCVNWERGDKCFVGAVLWDRATGNIFETTVSGLVLKASYCIERPVVADGKVDGIKFAVRQAP